MTFEEFVSKGAAAQSAVNELNARCLCGHLRVEHRKGFYCVALEKPGGKRSAICTCKEFRNAAKGART